MPAIPAAPAARHDESSEKRRARVLLLLSNFGKEGKPEPMIAKISQETLSFFASGPMFSCGCGLLCGGTTTCGIFHGGKYINMNCFVALDRAPRSLERAEAELGVDSSLDGAMILFDDVVEMGNGTAATASTLSGRQKLVAVHDPVR